MNGKELRRLRLQAGESQEKFGRRIGLHRNAMGNYETGKRKIPLHVAIAAECVVKHQGAGR